MAKKRILGAIEKIKVHDALTKKRILDAKAKRGYLTRWKIIFHALAKERIRDAMEIHDAFTKKRIAVMCKVITYFLLLYFLYLEVTMAKSKIFDAMAKKKGYYAVDSAVNHEGLPRSGKAVESMNLTLTAGFES
jgi:hypothetical protein